jgi:hypothetical protein
MYSKNVFFFLTVLSLVLTQQSFYHDSHTSSPFGLVIFEKGLTYAQAGLD